MGSGREGPDEGACLVHVAAGPAGEMQHRRDVPGCLFDARTRREITSHVFDAGKTAGITRHVFGAGKGAGISRHVFGAGKTAGITSHVFGAGKSGAITGRGLDSGKGGGRWTAGEDPEVAGSFEQGQDVAAEGSGAAGDEKEWGHGVGRHILRGSGVKDMTPGDEGM
ncbi:hypothetical protein Ahu01nite_074570 [Winogradskya humida]|uniref:Uncharacterized protein n=1 Tax=Winogradskya humida TaxID=113566 RepID=A0ABQ4A0G4_9ACTN|nr:hypothetical protein Ahu01nite_074570 [Actinoplanes humidus]